jgi:ABC-2 type transport system ATP-binding protein
MVLEVKNLSKKFGNLVAVDSISFSVDQGEIFGFLGPNGAGKTTTLRMLTGIIEPDSGSIKLLGYDVKEDPIRVKERIGVVPENANPYVDITAWQNMMITCGLYDLTGREAEEKSAEILRDFGIYDRRDQKVKEFSKGMKQRLVLSMALVHDPDFLFLDEPTSGLDVRSSLIIVDKLKKLSEDGKTIFLTTHNMWEAEKLCERIAIINHGRIITVERPHVLRETTERLRRVEILFDKKISPEDLQGYIKVDEFKGNRIILKCEDLNPVLTGISAFIRDSEGTVKVRSFNTLTPSLEEIFLKIAEG